MSGPARVSKPTERSIAVGGVHVPRMVYGTAWKQDETARLTRRALDAGFRGFDTANQRRHYFEAGVGDALKEALRAGAVRRDEVFVQTKFTYAAGQDHRLPYDVTAPVGRQVQQSFESSLDHLGLEYIDAYLLHGPSTYPTLGDPDWEAWTAMEQLHREGRARLIGASNVTLEQINELLSNASVRPAVVQNRCFTRPHADAEVRRRCRVEGMAYQGFSLLTANRLLLVHPVTRRIMARTGATAPQVVLAYALAQGMVVLTGTTSPEHMTQDLDVFDNALDPGEIAALDRIVS